MNKFLLSMSLSVFLFSSSAFAMWGEKLPLEESQKPLRSLVFVRINAPQELVEDKGKISFKPGDLADYVTKDKFMGSYSEYFPVMYANMFSQQCPLTEYPFGKHPTIEYPFNEFVAVPFYWGTPLFVETGKRKKGGSNNILNTVEKGASYAITFTEETGISITKTSDPAIPGDNFAIKSVCVPEDYNESVWIYIGGADYVKTMKFSTRRPAYSFGEQDLVISLNRPKDFEGTLRASGEKLSTKGAFVNFSGLQPWDICEVDVDYVRGTPKGKVTMAMNNRGNLLVLKNILFLLMVRPLLEQGGEL